MGLRSKCLIRTFYDVKGQYKCLLFKSELIHHGTCTISNLAQQIALLNKV